jgi:uncharacterized DUF497 family protein
MRDPKLQGLYGLLASQPHQRPLFKYGLPRGYEYLPCAIFLICLYTMGTLDPQLIGSSKNEANVAYRVTGIPIDYKLKQVKSLLQTVLQLDKAGNSVKLRSIAISPNRKTKVATVCFSCRPTLLPPRADGEWHFPIPAENNGGNSSDDDDDDIIPQEQIITVDSHFKGITVLRSFSKLDEHKIVYE